jgi:hypothetical protein
MSGAGAQMNELLPHGWMMSAILNRDSIKIFYWNTAELRFVLLIQ